MKCRTALTSLSIKSVLTRFIINQQKGRFISMYMDNKWCDEEKKIFAGQLYTPGDPELVKIKLKAHNLSVDYNSLHEDETEKRQAILNDLFWEFGPGSFMQGPIYIHYGSHTRIGHDSFFNFNTTIQDDSLVTIGNNNNFGPGLYIGTPLHPMLASERHKRELPNGSKRGFCYAKPVMIGNDCWFGVNVTICPGVTVGNGCVIGAGSVVIKDVPDNTFAAGVPARIIRTIKETESLRNETYLLGEYAEYF